MGGVNQGMYLDSAIIVKLVVMEPDSMFYAEQIDGAVNVCSSELILTECWSALYRKKQNNAIDDITRKKAWGMVEDMMRDGSLGLLPVTDVVLRKANTIIAKCAESAAIRTLDAIHLATCDMNNAFPLFTNDRIMRKAAAVMKFELGPVA